jgi:hypothetical protein
MKKHLLYLPVFILILLLRNLVGYAQEEGKSDGFETLYRNAIANSIYPEHNKVSKNLLAITEANKRLIWKTINHEQYVLVVTWQADTSYYHRNSPYNTGNYMIWVTAVPELKDVCRRSGDSDLRLKQRFGLPPDAKKKFFVEFWVRPADLFRPCPDSDITDSECQLCFPANTDSSYISWFNRNRVNSYYNCTLYSTYPWTQLGYSYDWNPDNRKHTGFSEFIIGKNKDILVNNYYTSEDYCRGKHK